LKVGTRMGGDHVKGEGAVVHKHFVFAVGRVIGAQPTNSNRAG
jgi:hypothetical protein